MKRFLYTLVAFSFFGYQLQAAHIVGGQLYYEDLGNDLYVINLKLYRDMNCGGCATFDFSAFIGVFDASAAHTHLQTHTLPRRYVIDSIPFDLRNPCVDLPENIRYGEALYSDTFELPESLWGYELVYQRCCRTSNIINLMNPDNFGVSLVSRIPGIVNNAPVNSSPVFDKLPPVAMCIGDQLEFDHSAVDADGDSLTYEFYTPLNGGGTSPNGNCNTPLPNPPCYNTITEVPWANGYNENYQLDGNPGITIDPQTGFLYGSPSQMGRYIIGIKVNEFRNGFPLGYTTQEFLVTVTQCELDTTTAIADQLAFCNGLTTVFLNNSANADSSTIWSWDFGDPNNPNDTSSAFSPTYTYSDTGTYEITLIANAGYACADTAYSLYTIDGILAPAYEPPDAQCLVDNSYDFTALGWFVGNGTFSWDFGSAANPNTSNLQDPTSINFLDTGYHVVSFTITEDGCSETFTDSIYVQLSPDAAFDISSAPEGCAPFAVGFENLSVPANGLSFSWSFGDGGSSIEESPNHVYANEGMYQAALSVSTMDGCTDNYDFPSAITVYESPTAGFEFSSSEIALTDPFLEIMNTSIDGTNCEYFLQGQQFSDSCDFSLTLSNPGVFEFVQIVTNALGCADTSIKQLTVVDDRNYTIYAPNAITPNNDNLNDRWTIVGIDLYPNNRVQIFNRWGTLVHETAPYDNTSGWDGSSKGQPLPAGTYMYIIDLGDVENTSLAGAINLIR